MKKEVIIATLKEIDKKLDSLSNDLDKSPSKFVSKKQLMQDTEIIAKSWFETVEPYAENYGIKEIIGSKYHNLFEILLELSLKTSRKVTYQKTIYSICVDFKEELTVAALKSAEKVNYSNLPDILENATQEEKEYLIEALGCAEKGFLRASMVLVWCAVINRMHKTVEKLGIVEFSKKSQEMKKIRLWQIQKIH